MKGEVWLRAETPAVVRATLLEKPGVAARLLRRAKSPVIVVGHEAAGGAGSCLLDAVVRIARATDSPVVATGGVSAELGRMGSAPPMIIMSAMEAGDRLLDPAWQPAPGRRPPDYAFLLGIPFPIASVIEAGLASFAQGHLKIISLDRLYHPHCDLSLPNQTREEWEKNLGAIAEEVEKG
jgi:CO dehydrogenase/acetyl-CoA synthase complex epsilon subunit